MIGKLALALASLTLASPAVPQAIPAYVKHPGIRQVVCDEGMGSAFSIGGGKFVTAEHVSNNSNCEIDRQPIVNFYVSARQDFAVVTSAAEASPIEIDCGGYRDGEVYFAAGYAGGYPKQRLIIVRGSMRAMQDGKVILTGSPTVIPGMSGGPILDSAGRVVGIVNSYNTKHAMSMSRELADTYLCKGAS